MLEAVKRIARAVELPVTADMEAGYGDTAKKVAETVKGVIAAGAVGMNLEDGYGPTDNRLVDISLQVEKIKAVREVALSADIQFVLNARTDVYWLGVGDPASRYDDTVRRAKAYRQAGADCIFVPGLIDATTIGRLVGEINCPVNILASHGAPSIPELARLGAARVSFGSGPMRATLALARRIAKELLGPGTYSALTQDSIPYADVNRLFERRAPKPDQQYFKV
jgi:2-methylisocitrate lyase-like PEP mutase family enzyme